MKAFVYSIGIIFQNWRVRHIGKARRVLIKALQKDPDFANTYFCNLAMPIYDGAQGKLTMEEANEIASRLMKHVFEVDDCGPR